MMARIISMQVAVPILSSNLKESATKGQFISLRADKTQLLVDKEEGGVVPFIGRGVNGQSN